MMNSQWSLPSVLSQFGLQSADLTVRSLGNADGMSGAAIWQLRSGPTLLCLRRWPTEHPSRERLVWIHGQLSRAARAGCDFLPIPLLSVHGDSFVDHEGHLWELTPWMPGQSDYHQHPSPTKLASALETLARFHQATSDPVTDLVAVSPGLQRRWRQMRATTPQHLNQLGQAIDSRYGPEVERLAKHIVRQAPACLQRATPLVDDARTLRTLLQPCLRDVWHDHVLFEGQRVTGLLDFGAMRIDSPAGDIARLLGSLVRDDPVGWQTGLQAYSAIRPLTPDQQRMLAAFDAANIAMAGLNWMRWLFIERRQFEQLERVEARLKEISLRV